MSRGQSNRNKSMCQGPEVRRSRTKSKSLKKAVVWSAESKGVEGIGGARGQVGLNLTCHCLKIE